MQNESGSKSFVLKLWLGSQILSDFVDYLHVHNGRDYRLVTVTEDMVGHKFGEFAYIRQRHSFKKKK